MDLRYSSKFIRRTVLKISRGFKRFAATSNIKQTKFREVAKCKDLQYKLKIYLSKDKISFRNKPQKTLELKSGTFEHNKHLSGLSANTLGTYVANVSPPVQGRSPNYICEKVCIDKYSCYLSYDDVIKSLNPDEIDLPPPMLFPKQLSYSVMDNGSIKITERSNDINNGIQSVNDLSSGKELDCLHKNARKSCEIEVSLMEKKANMFYACTQQNTFCELQPDLTINKKFSNSLPSSPCNFNISQNKVNSNFDSNIKESSLTKTSLTSYTQLNFNCLNKSLAGKNILPKTLAGPATCQYPPATKKFI